MKNTVTSEKTPLEVMKEENPFALVNNLKFTTKSGEKSIRDVYGELKYGNHRHYTLNSEQDVNTYLGTLGFELTEGVEWSLNTKSDSARVSIALTAFELNESGERDFGKFDGFDSWLGELSVSIIWQMELQGKTVTAHMCFEINNWDNYEIQLPTVAN